MNCLTPYFVYIHYTFSLLYSLMNCLTPYFVNIHYTFSLLYSLMNCLTPYFVYIHYTFSLLCSLMYCLTPYFAYTIPLVYCTVWKTVWPRIMYSPTFNLLYSLMNCWTPYFLTCNCQGFISSQLIGSPALSKPILKKLYTYTYLQFVKLSNTGLPT